MTTDSPTCNECGKPNKPVAPGLTTYISHSGCGNTDEDYIRQLVANLDARRPPEKQAE